MLRGVVSAAGDTQGVVLRAANQNRSIAGGNRSIIHGFDARERGAQCPLSRLLLALFLPRQEKGEEFIQYDKLEFEVCMAVPNRAGPTV